MSIFDGSEDELTFGEALCEMAQRVTWPTEKHKIAAVRAIQEEFDMVPPEPDPVVNLTDPRDVTIITQDRELAALRKKVEEAELHARLAQAEAASQRYTPVGGTQQGDDKPTDDPAQVGQDAVKAPATPAAAGERR